MGSYHYNLKEVTKYINTLIYLQHCVFVNIQCAGYGVLIFRFIKGPLPPPPLPPQRMLRTGTYIPPGTALTGHFPDLDDSSPQPCSLFLSFAELSVSDCFNRNLALNLSLCVCVCVILCQSIRLHICGVLIHRQSQIGICGGCLECSVWSKLTQS